jgi:hypothetical protein
VKKKVMNNNKQLGRASILAVIVAVAVYIYQKNRTNELRTMTKEEFCLDSDFVLFAQRKQWKRAKLEVYRTAQKGFGGGDMDFYLQPYGMTILNLTSVRLRFDPEFRPSNNDYDELVYYRIWKNGNSNIRSLLFQYAYMADDYQLKKSLKNLDFNYDSFLHHCAENSECAHPDISEKAAEYMKTYDSSSANSQDSKRYSFTFSRNPIDRFISGLTEIEYQMKVRNQHSFPFKHPYGSLLRVMEFIDFILLSNGSKRFFQNFGYLEILHIFPMIGTLLIHPKQQKNGEAEKLRIFPLENDFDSSWKELSEELFPAPLSGNKSFHGSLSDEEYQQHYFPNRTFYNLYHQRHQDMKNWKIHLSSYDSLSTSKAAKQFFAFANENVFRR